ncbi:alpha-galactosidase [Actinophytocola xanthii]|uniref:alpha-galactosidase n=1 Tax=Actinophytocola xanthii TaxID=1912961 RepID=UPI000A4DCE98|nr:glycoside hydrolase family 36 protein [Actinophytocola xanthii]
MGLVWGRSSLSVELAAPPDGPVRLAGLTAEGVSAHISTPATDTGQPLVEVLVAGEGHRWSGPRSVDTAVGARLRCAGHQESRADGWSVLEVDQVDDRTGLHVRVCFRTREGLPAVQMWTQVQAGVPDPVVPRAVSSLAATFSAADTVDGVEVHLDENDWLAESRWQRIPVRRRRSPDVDLGLHAQRPRGALTVVSHGSWSSDEYLPIGVLHDTANNHAWAWQIEHNDAWRREVDERTDGVYVTALGPNDADHQWQHPLGPEQEFVSAPVGLAAGAGFDAAAAGLTEYRQAIRREHPDNDALPVVFNDYMNTLDGDPITERLLPLIDAAAATGAEYFCIDAGWYDEDGTWWDSVGERTPSTTHFPSGLGEVIAHIRDAGTAPGPWLEPEVVGVRSPVAQSLPPEAFFQRDGHRQVEHGRYHLDLTHPDARAYLDATIDRLVTEFGIRYFKLDYNINPPGPARRRRPTRPAPGCSRTPGRTGAGWSPSLTAIPGGCWRTGRLGQCVPATRCCPACSCSPQATSATPCGTRRSRPPRRWRCCRTMCTGMLGRLYLSGHLNRISEAQLVLVREGVRAKAIRADLAGAVPFWPLGLPDWDAPWLALGLRSGTDTYLAVWRRPGADDTVSLPVPHLRGARSRLGLLYPSTLPAWSHSWRPDAGVLDLTATEAPSTRILRLTT